MAHTFDIRFARSEGLAALFEAPANHLRWKGKGRLSIDTEGISIAVKRGLLTLFARRSRRFSAGSLTEVYREGDSLRLVFQSPDKSEVLPVWAKGGQVAAEIVKLLPTQRSVELEHSTGTARRYRLDWRALTVATLAAAGVSGLLIMLLRADATPSPAPASSDRQAASGVLPAAGNDSRTAEQAPGGAAPAASSSATGVSKPQPPFAKDRRRLENPRRAAAAVAGPAVEDTVPAAAAVLPAAQPLNDSITLTLGEYADGLGEDAGLRLLSLFEEQSARGSDAAGWWELTVKIHTTPEFQRADLWALRECMLAVSRAWRADDQTLARTLTSRVADHFR